MSPDAKSNIKALIGLIFCLIALAGLIFLLYTAGKTVIADFQSSASPNTTITQDHNAHS